MHDFKNEDETHIAIHKQKIYEALSHDPFFKNLYDEMKKITNVDVELKSTIGKVEILDGPGPSPLTEDEIMKMPNDNLADFFKHLRLRTNGMVHLLTDLLTFV